jgi:RNA polymerase sigma-70 factor, ECF subfamily
MTRDMRADGTRGWPVGGGSDVPRDTRSTMEQAPLEFDTIHAEFRPRIRRYLARLAGDSDAEDLTQEVFLRVSRSLVRFRGESSIATWVYRIATNIALDRLRGRSSPERSEEPLADDGLADPAAPPDEAAGRDEMRQCIRKFVDRLPPDDRSVLVLSEFEGLADRDIAEVLGVTVGAAKIRLHRARARLRKALTEGCDLHHDERNELACDPTISRVSFRA